MSDEQRPLLEPTKAPYEDVPPPDEDPFGCPERGINHDGPKKTPLPIKQLAILLLIQLAEPLSVRVLSPFVAQFVNETGITGGDGSKIGYYAGLIESIFYLTESIFTLQYGRLSDRIGRRPVLMLGLFGQAISSFSVGLSKQFWQLVFSRALTGALNGNQGVAKSTLVELTDETNQAQAFAFMPIVWSTGSTVGSLIGGMLNHPAKLLPGVFGTPFWNEYPYFLPCLIAAMYSGSIFIITALFLKETHNAHPKHCTAPTRFPQPRHSVPIRSVLTRRACIAIANYAFIAFNDVAHFGLIPVMFAVPIKDGGLGFSPHMIGIFFSLQGIITGLFLVRFFAPLHRRLGSKRLYVAGYASYCCLIILLPIMRALAIRKMRRMIWVTIGLHVSISCIAYTSFSCMAILVNNSAPSKSSLGTLNGISQAVISIIRAIGPATATSLFSLSVEKNLLGGNFVYAVLLGVGCLGIYASQWVKEDKRAYE